MEAGLREHTGEAVLDILVNNAAVTTPNGALEDVSAEQIDALFAVNAKAPFLLVQRALGLIPDGGRIINISSAVTRKAIPPQVVYAMSKGALDQLTLHDDTTAQLAAEAGGTWRHYAPGDHSRSP